MLYYPALKLVGGCAVALLVGLGNARAAAPEKPAGEAARANVLARLKANGVSLDSLRGSNGPAFLNLGIGVNGNPASNANDENLKLVAQLPELEHLMIVRGTFTRDGIAALAALPKLRLLTLSESAYTPEAIAPLANLQNLKVLSFNDCLVNDTILGFAAKLQGLESLTISKALGKGRLEVSAAGVAAFLDQVPGLKELVLLDIPLDDSCIERVSRRTALSKFWTNSQRITPKAWPALASLTAMRDLYLQGTTFDDAAAPALAKMPNLKSLILDDTRVTDKAMPALAELVKITDLGLARTGITDAGLSHLRGMTELHNLYVVGTKVTVQGLRVVPKKEGMSMLRIGDKPLSPTEMQDLRAMFQRTEVFDPAGFLSPAREAAALRQINAAPATRPAR